MKQGRVWLLHILSVIIWLTAGGCGGSGGGISLALVPSGFQSVSFDPPGVTAQLVGVDKSGAVLMFYSGHGFYKWTEYDGLQTFLATTQMLSGIMLGDDGTIAATDQMQNVVTVDASGTHPLLDAHGQQLRGSVVGFTDDGFVGRDQSGNIVFPGKDPVALKSPTGEPYTGPYAHVVGPSGVVAGSLLRPNGGFLYPWAAKWNADGTLVELGKPISDQYQSDVSVVFDDGTIVGTSQSNSATSMARWSSGGHVLDQIVSTGVNGFQINSASKNGYVIGVSDVNGQGFIWTPTSGMRSLTDMTTAKTGDTHIDQVVGLVVNKQGYIAGQFSVTVGSGVQSKFFLLKPIP